MSDAPIEVALSIRAQHAEGPMWDAATQRLWWVDIAGERVHCFDPASGDDDSWSTTGQPGGVVISAAGDPVVASPDGLAVLDRTTGAMNLRVPVERDITENRANDIKVDDRGRAWVGTMALDKRPGNASLYRVDGDVVTPVVDGLTISKGQHSTRRKDASASPTPPSASLTCSTWTRQRERSANVGDSWMSLRPGSGRTV